MRSAASLVNQGIPGKGPVALRWSCVILAACWALTGAGLGVWAFRFWWTQPVPVLTPANDSPVPAGYTMLDALIQAVGMAALLAVLSAALIGSGIGYLRAARATGRWRIAWTCFVVAAARAEMAFIAVFFDPFPLFGQVLGHPDWAMLAFPAVFVIVGAAMIAVITAAARTARRAAEPSPEPAPAMRFPGLRPGRAGSAWAAARVALWASAGTSALLGSVGWSFADESAATSCCSPYASRLPWVLAGAAGQWALVIAVALLAVIGWRRPLRLRAVTLLAAALVPLAIIWFVVTTRTAAATNW